MMIKSKIRKKKVIKWVKISFVLILIVLLGEFVLRFFSSDLGDTRVLYDPSKTRTWKFNPNAEVKWDITEESRGYTTIKINSKGLRDYEYSYEHPESTYRIINLGNSMAVGFEVDLEDSFPKVMEKMGGDDFEVVNLAVKAYDLEQEFVSLEEEGLLYNPDLVMITFFVGSDFNRAETGNIFSLKDRQLVRNYNVYNPKFMELRNFLYKYSSLYNALISLVKLPFSKEKDEGFDINKQIESYKGDTTKLYMLIKHFQEVLNEKDIEFLIVIMPVKQQIYEDWFKEMVDTYGEGKSYDEFDVDAPTDELKVFLKENNINFIDLYPILKKESEQNILYLGFDKDSRHLSKKAHKIIGESLYFKWKEMYNQD